jgi:hypothetical protein
MSKPLMNIVKTPEKERKTSLELMELEVCLEPVMLENQKKTYEAGEIRWWLWPLSVPPLNTC